MRVAFFSEAGYVGKVPRNNPNMRTDMAWVCALDATHIPVTKIDSFDGEFDLGILIIPKNKEHLFNFPLVEHMRRLCKKISTMQESTYWYWQDGSIQSQLWYHSVLQSMDIIFCHNDMDLRYYRGITDVRCELLPSLMITDYVKEYDGERKGVAVGGNWVSAYRGFDSYLIGKILDDNISAITTGRMKPDEKLLDINHLPWMTWIEWIYELSKHKYGIQLGTAAAGTFNLNCAYLGIPCISYDTINTQKYLHPLLSVSDGDIECARKLATKLANDEGFYKECSISAKENYEKLYTEESFLKHIKEIVTDEL